MLLFPDHKTHFTVNKMGGGEEILNYMRTHLGWLRISLPPSGKYSPDPELLNRLSNSFLHNMLCDV